VGLLDAQADGAGFDALAFAITREGIPVVSETFLDVASALAYFDDRVPNLGDLAAGVTGNLDLALSLSLTSDDPGAAFRTRLLLAHVPEPGSSWLLGAGLAGLATLRRRGVGVALPRSW